MNRCILIVGPSGSGKTTVAEIVARELGVPLISMDDFRVRRRWPLYVDSAKKLRTFESPLLWDGRAIACKLRACIQAGSGFVTEGNHLLYYPEIAALPDVECFYLNVPFAVSLKRRQARHRGTEADRAFALVGESEIKRYVLPQRSVPGITVLDGTTHVANSVADILGFIHAGSPLR